MATPDLNQVLRVDVVDNAGEPLPNATVQFYRLDNNGLLSTARTARAPATIQLNQPTALRVEATYESEIVKQDVAASADRITISFPNVRLISPKERWVSMGVGLFLVLVVLVLASINPNIIGFVAFAYRFVLALGGGLIASGIAGFIKADLKVGQYAVITASGAFAVFVIAYFFNPPTL